LAEAVTTTVPANGAARQPAERLCVFAAGGSVCGNAAHGVDEIQYPRTLRRQLVARRLRSKCIARQRCFVAVGRGWAASQRERLSILPLICYGYSKGDLQMADVFIGYARQGPNSYAVQRPTPSRSLSAEISTMCKSPILVAADRSACVCSAG
jgi:hypothetical protein